MFYYTQINYRFILLHVLYLRIFEMARLVAVCRTDDYQFDRRQLPLAVDDNLKVCIEYFLLIMFPLISERWSHLVLNIVQRPYWCFNLHSLLLCKKCAFIFRKSVHLDTCITNCEKITCWCILIHVCKLFFFQRVILLMVTWHSLL